MTMQKQFYSIGLGLALLAGLAVQGSPLKKEEISGDAKWLVHLDVTAFLHSEVGSYVYSEMLSNHLAQATAGLKAGFGVDLDWNKVSAISIYGTKFKDKGGKQNKEDDLEGVLLIRADLSVEKLIEDAIRAMKAKMQEGQPSPIQKVEGSKYPLYRMQDEVYFGCPGKNLLLVTKSKQALDTANVVFKDKKESLASKGSLGTYVQGQEGIILVAVAEGFAQDLDMPPQAKMLQSAEGGRISLGEKDEKLQLKVSLKAKTQEEANQMQQIVQGLVALASMSQAENKQLAELVNAVRVTADERLVTLGLDYASKKAIQQIKENITAMGVKRTAEVKAGEDNGQVDQGDEKPAAKKPKKKKKKKTDEEKASDEKAEVKASDEAAKADKSPAKEKSADKQ